MRRGFCQRHEKANALDPTTVDAVLGHIHRAGIGHGIYFDMTDAGSATQSLHRLSLALEASPAPEFEWVRMEEVLGLELLSKLVGIATVSIRRYLAKTRTTPDDVAARLHVFSLIVGDLNGAYNDAGIRQWFQRRRTQLDGKSPIELLVGNWRPDDEIVARLRALSSALGRSGRFSGYVIVVRHCDPRFPFQWEEPTQSAGRWNAEGSSTPVQYFADTPEGAWAEFLRHEGITTEEELANIRRAMGAVELPDSYRFSEPSLPDAVLTGGWKATTHVSWKRRVYRPPAQSRCRRSRPPWFVAQREAGRCRGFCRRGPIETAWSSPFSTGAPS